MTTTTYYVDTASSGGDGTTRNHSGSTAAFATLVAAEAALQSTINVGDEIIIKCAGSTAETAGTVISGWTINGALTVMADDAATDNDGFYDGDLAWSTSHWRVDTSTSFAGISINEANVTLDGLQLRTTRAGGIHGVEVADGGVVIKNCRLTAPTASGRGIVGNIGTFRTEFTAYNNIIFDCGTAGILFGGSGTVVKTQRAYNNTIFGCGVAISYAKDDADLTYDFYNNVLYNNTTNIDTAPSLSAWNHDYNAIDEATNSETNGVALTTTVTDDMTDPENGTLQSADVTPITGSGLISTGVGSGTDSNVPTTDILGVSRSSSAPTIGAFEFVSSGLSITAIPKSFTFSAQSATVGLGLDIVASPASFTFSAQQAAIALGIGITATPASFTFSPQSATIGLGLGIVAVPDSFTFSAQAAVVTIADLVTITAIPATWTLAGSTASVNLGLGVVAVPANFALQGSTGAIGLGLDIVALPGSFTFAGSTATFNLLGTATVKIDGANNKVISSAYGSVRLYNNGTHYFTI